MMVGVTAGSKLNGACIFRLVGIGAHKYRQFSVMVCGKIDHQ